MGCIPRLQAESWHRYEIGFFGGTKRPLNSKFSSIWSYLYPIWGIIEQARDNEKEHLATLEQSKHSQPGILRANKRILPGSQHPELAYRTWRGQIFR
jgi:hypothetical protein